MTLALEGEKIGRNRFTGSKIENSTFYNCDFSGTDLTGTEFIGCQFYDRDSQQGGNFSRALLKDAAFKSCDLSMADFRNASALGIEIRDCRAQGADFRGASFMNMITTRTWLCSAYITKTNLSYANFSKVVSFLHSTGVQPISPIVTGPIRKTPRNPITPSVTGS